MRRGSKSRVASLQSNKYNLRSAPGLPDQRSDQQVDPDNMTSFEGRDDPEYLNSLEEELIKSRKAREEETKLLQSLISKMDRMEKSSTRSSAVPAVGRGILRTPLKSTPEVGASKGAGPVPPSLAGLLAEEDRDSAPADFVSGSLTSALQQLSIAIDPTPQSSTKGLLLRPEYYVQHKDKGVAVKSLDHSKLTFKELMSGMGRVMVHLSKTGGELKSYIDHFNYLVRQAATCNFQDSAFVAYDRHVVDQFINGESESFRAGDLLGVALNFHVGNLAPVRPAYARGRGRGFRRGGRQSQGYETENEREWVRDQQVPEGFPEDICFKYNYRVCTGKCAKLHVCRHCRGLHKASSSLCPSSKR